ncbi:hypothetical protein Tco_1204549 [Tanacetum coccineum]
MLAIPHLSQVSSMAEIVSKEAQKKSKAGICFRITSHNKHTLFLSLQRSTSCKSKTSAINRAFLANIELFGSDDQAIQAILSRSFLMTSLPALIVVKRSGKLVTCAHDCEWSDIGIQEKKAKLFNEWERFTSTDGESIESYFTIAQPSMNLGQDRQMQMVGGHGGNQFRQYAGQNVGNQNRYNAVQNVGNQVVQNSVQNPGVKNVGNQNGLIVVPGIANPIANQIGNGNVVAARAEGNANGNNDNQIRCYNYRGLGHLARNCTVRPRRRDVKCKYVTRNTGKGRKNEENTDSYKALRRNPYDSVTPLRHLSQHYGVTWTLDYAVKSFKPAIWKVHVSSLRRKPLNDYALTY